MRLGLLIVGVAVIGSSATVAARPVGPARLVDAPVVSGLIGPGAPAVTESPPPVARPPAAPAAPIAPAPPRAPVVAPVAPAVPAPPLAPGSTGAPVAKPSALEPVPPPITAAALQGLVSPAVVALLVSGGQAPARVVPGVLVTASGLVLTSRTAVANAADGTAMITMLRGGPRGRLSARELADAYPMRFVAVSDELDLALVEAMPPTSIFFPHLPIARRSAAAGATVLGVGHVEKGGLWTAVTTVMGPVAQGAGAARWLRELSPDGAALPLGTPLFDAVGRVVALVASPGGAGPRVADADGILRFLLAANAPALRFAGVPPFRRPVPGMEVRGSGGARGAPGGAPRGADAQGEVARERASDLAMPGMTRKGSLDRNFPTAAGPRAGQNPGAAPVAVEKNMDKVMPAAGAPTFEGLAGARRVPVADLEKHSPPATVTVDVHDVPERGPRGGAVTIVEFGDYHAPDTREAEAAVRALVEGPNAHARLLWKDVDRGDGDEYHFAARAAQAAREQNQFWEMHDILLKAPQPISMKDLRRIARAFELELPAFEAAFASEGLVGTLELEAERAAHLPALTTPSFIVNGHVVDGGTASGPALRAAVDQELAVAEAKADKQPVDAAVARRERAIAPGKPVAGTAFDPTKLARTVAAASAKRGGKK